MNERIAMSSARASLVAERAWPPPVRRMPDRAGNRRIIEIFSKHGDAQRQLFSGRDSSCKRMAQAAAIPTPIASRFRRKECGQRRRRCRETASMLHLPAWKMDTHMTDTRRACAVFRMRTNARSGDKMACARRRLHAVSAQGSIGFTAFRHRRACQDADAIAMAAARYTCRPTLSMRWGPRRRGEDIPPRSRNDTRMVDQMCLSTDGVMCSLYRLRRRGCQFPESSARNARLARARIGLSVRVRRPRR